MKWVINIVMIVGTTVAATWTASAQREETSVVGASLRVTASASVMNNITLTTIRDISVGTQTAVQGIITMNPTNSPFAGMMRIDGTPNSVVRVTYLTNETLIDEGGSGGTVRARYQISGFDSDNQMASALLDVGEAAVRLNKEGRYFLWLGAIIDIKSAKPGQYVSEFVLEVEAN